MEQDIIPLVNNQVRQALLHALTQIPSCDRSPKPSAPSRCQSLNNNRRAPAYHTISRTSLPTIHSDQILYETVPCANTRKSKRAFGVQYSFSLNQPLFNKANEHDQQLSEIRSFVDRLIQDALHTVLHQAEDDDDIVPTSPDVLQTTNAYIDEFVRAIVRQIIELISSSNLEQISNRVAEDALVSALSAIGDRALTEVISTSCQLNPKSIDVLVNTIAQQIHTDSFQELQRILTIYNDKN